MERSTNKVILEGTVYYIHVVEPGQTLYSIARAYQISQKEITVENPSVIAGLQVGQALKIPVQPTMVPEVDTSPEQEGDSIHSVKPGETIYSIARSYGLEEEELLQANPGVDPEEMSPGLLLKIPSPAGEGPEPAYDEEGIAYHEVKRRETLYSIARFYGVSVQDIRAANPELGWGGPRAGQTIRVPLPQAVDQPERLRDTVPAKTEDELPADTVPEPYRYEELEIRHHDPFRTYRVAFFIPFQFTEQEPLDSLLADVRSESRRGRIIERYRMEERTPQAVQFLEFFQGTLLAVDSLKKTGMELDVRYYDTRRSVDRTLEILMAEGLEDFDLFIGPFYHFNLEIAGEFARKHRIPLVTPFYNEKEQVRDNPYLLQVSPSLEEEYKAAAKLVASRHRYNIVYIRERDTLDLEQHELFKELIYQGFDDYRPSEPVVFKEVIHGLAGLDEILHSLSADRKNLVVVPTRNEALASRVISSLYYQLRDFDIEVLGGPFWPEFSSIDYRYFHELNLIFYSSFWVNYHDHAVEAYLEKYRNHYFTEPESTTRKGASYGILGYDISYYFLDALRRFGPRFILHLNEFESGQVQIPYRFARVSNRGGFENTEMQFYQFTPDLDIRKIEVPDVPRPHYFFRPIPDPRERRYLNKDLHRK